MRRPRERRGSLAQGASGLSILVEIEKYAGTARPDKAWQPPEVVAA